MAFSNDGCASGMHRNSHPGGIDGEEGTTVFPREHAARVHGLSFPSIEAKDSIGFRDRIPTFDVGSDPLGILMTVNMEVGLCHPPVGLNLYVASGIARMGITELTIATWPWLVTMLIFLVMVTYIPELSLWLPRMLGML